MRRCRSGLWDGNDDDDDDETDDVGGHMQCKPCTYSRHLALAGINQIGCCNERQFARPYEPNPSKPKQSIRATKMAAELATGITRDIRFSERSGCKIVRR